MPVPAWGGNGAVNIASRPICLGLSPSPLSLMPIAICGRRSSLLILVIRRYVYHDVIRLGDAEKLMGCGCVQQKQGLNAFLMD
ncbi:Hypothetical predicted protein [Olea europaea subsp. europaea]|uniref:Uncharacterized protein n=1 Tax=Olea europaea subsp. europaea TaxID=158383 RepID=A0A8S0Q7E0_OLEEU|nr:Hypothetical predicted protein [Olea europaea subsp. europaea]